MQRIGEKIPRTNSRTTTGTYLFFRRCIYNSWRQKLDRKSDLESYEQCRFNCSHGKIIITANTNQFMIENTGNRIAQEDFPHVFEMLYTSDKSRTNNQNTPKHLGMGLYLAKKIFDLHDLKISIENTLTGVCVMVSKQSYLP